MFVRRIVPVVLYIGLNLFSADLAFCIGKFQYFVAGRLNRTRFMDSDMAGVSREYCLVRT